MIRVEPALDRRECFARWAVAQTPKIRTADHNAFSVPADLFTLAPEETLLGALVDGRPYISPDEELTGYVHPERDGISGGWLPEVPPEAYGPDSVPLDFAPLEDAPAGDEDDQAAGDVKWPEGITPPRPEFVEAAMDAVLIATEVRADRDRRDRRDSAAKEPTPAADSDSSDPSGDEDQAPDDGYPCDLCDRSFTTARGRRTHRRQTHPNRRS